MKILFIIIILMVISPITLQAIDKTYVNLKIEAESKLRELVPQLSVVEEKYSNNPQMLLGLAMIYARYGSTMELYEHSIQLYQKAIALNPNDKFANIGLINRKIEDFSRQSDEAIESLKGLKEYAKKNNIKDLEVPTWAGSLYDMLKEKDQEKVIIKDFNDTKATLEKKFDSDLQIFLTEIDKAGISEPENAIYSYIRAQLYLYLGKDNEAIEELEKGSRKTSLNNYHKEIFNAQMRVLQEVNFPESYRKVIGDNLATSYSGLPNDIKVFEIAKKSEDSGNIQKAKQIYETIIRIANQIREEPVPIENGKSTVKRGENDYSLRIEKQAKNNLDKIQGTYLKEYAKQQKPLGVALPIAGAAVAVIVIAGVVMFIRKKNPKKAE
jgi:tetratricopeptide (TPR) repeat protein